MRAQEDEELEEEPKKLSIEARPLTSFWQHLYEGDFAAPTSVFYDPWAEEVLVCDTGNDLVGIFSREGLPLYAFGRNEHVRAPVRVAADRSGRIYVLDGDRKRIKLFSYRGEYLSDVPLPGLRPDPILTTFTIDVDGYLYVADSEAGEILVYEPGGRLKLRFGAPDEEEEPLRAVAAIAATRTEIVVVSYLGTAVHVFDRHGNRLRSWGEHAMGTQNFSLPGGAVVDANGRIIVSDSLRHDVKVFDPNGKFIDHFGGMGAGPGDVAQPAGLAMDPDGRIYVAEKLGNRVQVLELSDVYAGLRRNKRRPIATPTRGNWRYAMQPPPRSRVTR